MRKQYFIISKIGIAAEVKEDDFNRFMEIFEALHPEYVVKNDELKGHLFTSYYANNDLQCWTVD